MQLHGIHHVTAVTAQPGANLHFYTHVLGMRLVKKTVNQDDVSAYHLFYADKLGSPGTDMTFFDWPIPRERRGSDSIAGTMLRVPGPAALDFWAERLAAHGTESTRATVNGRAALRLDDPEGQRLVLVDDGGAPFHGEVWDEAGVPAEHALRGFYAVLISVPRLTLLSPVLTMVLGFAEAGRYAGPDDATVVVYTMDGGGPGNEVHVVEEPNAPRARLGAGGVHHVAFRVKDDAEQLAWREQIARTGLGITEQIDRFYFKSLYFRVSNGVLFEIATDGPGFAADEDPAALGERLSLPPFLEPQRARIEAGLKPLAPAGA
jgi:glyoxalase family protein